MLYQEIWERFINIHVGEGERGPPLEMNKTLLYSWAYIFSRYPGRDLIPGGKHERRANRAPWGLRPFIVYPQPGSWHGFPSPIYIYFFWAPIFLSDLHITLYGSEVRTYSRNAGYPIFVHLYLTTTETTREEKNENKKERLIAAPEHNSRKNDRPKERSSFRRRGVLMLPFWKDQVVGRREYR